MAILPRVAKLLSSRLHHVASLQAYGKPLGDS